MYSPASDLVLDYIMNPKAIATREAMALGTKRAASDAGLGAGASWAATEEAMRATVAIAKNIFIFIASIASKICRDETRRENEMKARKNLQMLKC